jgi:UDP-3-O-[3-hydroxymyristoyl] glucosamine N-acyltransferase
LKKYSLADIKKILGAKVNIKGNSKDRFFNNVNTILDANEMSLVWLDSKKKDKNELAKNTKAKVIITDGNVDIKKLLTQKTFVIVEHPKLAFIQIATKLFTPKIKYGIHPGATVSEEAKIDKDVYIGPNTVIGKCEIKKGAIIYGNSFFL